MNLLNTVTIFYGSHRRLIKCIALSLAIHTAAVTVLYFNPLILQGPFKSLFGMTATTPIVLNPDEENNSLLHKKNQVLEEVFEQIVVFSPHLQQPYDLVELPKGIALAPNEEETVISPPQDAPFSDLTLQNDDVALTSTHEFQGYEEKHVSPLFLPQEIETPVATQLQLDPQSTVSEIPPIAVPTGFESYGDLVALSDFSIKATFETDHSLNLSLPPISPSTLKDSEYFQLKADTKPQVGLVTSQDLKLASEKVRSTLFIPKASQLFTETREVKVASALSELEQYDFPPMAMAAEWNNDFDIDVVFLPNPEGQGYIFSLAVQPNYDFSSHGLRQNLYFILDRTNSVQKHRFAVFKRAVLKALASMQHGDLFNIFIMDRKLLTFSPQSRPVTMKNIQAAEEFLDKEEAGGLFAAGEIYNSLEKILTDIPENEEIHTAILLTDGKSSLNHKHKQNALKKWVEANNGKLALYAAAVGRDNDLVALDMFCSLSGGKLLYSDTHASLPRKLAKLVLDLKDPIAKDLMITAIPHNPHSHIEFYPASSHLPSLYSHQPFILIGKIDDPCAFELVIQGRHREEWIAIKKIVSFVEGQKGTQTLESQWSAQRANLCYTKFLKEGNATHLKEAKEILKKFRQEIAVE